MEEIGIPILPRSIANVKPTVKNRIRYFLHPEEQQPSYDGIEQALQSAIKNAGIIQWTEGAYGIFGITEEELRRLLYVPGTSEEADAKVKTYRSEVTGILQPKRLVCNLKIRPLLKPGYIKFIPTSLKHSYFGGGC